jgi:hypothetical protein
LNAESDPVDPFWMKTKFCKNCCNDPSFTKKHK